MSMLNREEKVRLVTEVLGQGMQTHAFRHVDKVYEDSQGEVDGFDVSRLSVAELKFHIMHTETDSKEMNIYVNLLLKKLLSEPRFLPVIPHVGGFGTNPAGEIIPASLEKLDGDPPHPAKIY